MQENFEITNIASKLEESSQDTIYLLYVNSSNIKAVGKREGVLYIQFKSNVVYSYLSVPNEVIKGLLEVGKKGVESIGEYFNKNIRSQNYQYSKLGKYEI